MAKTAWFEPVDSGGFDLAKLLEKTDLATARDKAEEALLAVAKDTQAKLKSATPEVSGKLKKSIIPARIKKTGDASIIKVGYKQMWRANFVINGTKGTPRHKPTRANTALQEILNKENLREQILEHLRGII